MRLDEPVDSTGEFWLPGSADDKVPGTLRIAQNGEVTLELSGALSGPAASFRQRRPGRYQLGGRTEEHPTRLLGVIRDGGAVTLDRCQPPSWNLRPASGLATSVIHADFAYIGVWYDENEEIVFDEIDCLFEGLEIWLSINSIEREYDNHNRIGSIRYHIPDDIPVTIRNGVEARLVFGLASPSAPLQIPEASIKQTAHLSLKLATAQPLDGFASLAFKFCNFLAFALDQDLEVRGITGHVDVPVSEDQVRRSRVMIFCRLGPEIAREAPIRRHDAMFLYPQVADRIDTITSGWFDIYETCAPAINLYFASRNQTAAFLDTHVLWLAQALETLHRRTSDETDMAEKEFQKRYESIMKNCPPNERRWLCGKLRYANSLPFRKRMRKLVEPFKGHFGSNTQREYFISRVCDTRNFLTHYDEGTTSNRAVEGADLFALRDKMAALFQLHLLKHIGLEQSLINHFVSQNSRLQRKLEPAA